MTVIVLFINLKPKQLPMPRRIYHGSPQRLEHPRLLGGKPYNDYGNGFYCTENLNMAAEWAVGIDHDGWINEYDIDCDGLVILDLNGRGFSVLHWLAVLLENRTFDLSYALAREAREYILQNLSVDYSSADIINGYRADDSYFSFAQDFLSGAISFRQLRQAMHLGHLGNQFVLKSRRSFDRLKFVGATFASKDTWYPLRARRDANARADYFSSRNQRRRPDDLFIIQIIDEGIKADDSRLH